MMSLRPSHVRCDAMRSQLQLANQRDATTRLPSSSLLGDRIRGGCKMTPAAAFVPVLRERGKGGSNPKYVCVQLCSVLAASIGVAVKYHASHWTGRHTTLQQQQRRRPKPRPFSFESDVAKHGVEPQGQHGQSAHWCGTACGSHFTNCGERRTISPPHFDVLLLSP
jgi:hypothetical protein